MADAALWYEERSEGLGAEFLRAVDVSLAEIARMPAGFPDVHKGIRRAFLRRFPYAIYYVYADDLIQVVGYMHVKRDPRRWQRRAG